MNSDSDLGLALRLVRARLNAPADLPLLLRELVQLPHASQISVLNAVLGVIGAHSARCPASEHFRAWVTAAADTVTDKELRLLIDGDT